MAAAKRKTITADNLQNLVTGMGTEKDARSFTTFANVEIPQSQLDIAYRNDWIARKVVDLPAFDATRQWRGWQAQKEQITALENVEKAFNLQRKVMQSIQKARLYGGGALIMGINQGKPSDPVDLNAIKKDDLKFVHAVSRYDINAGPIEQDITSPFYGEPQYYDRNAQAGVNSIRLHPSRVVRVIGAERFDLLSNLAWGDPSLQVVSDAIKACGTVSSAVAALVDEAKLDVISIPGLTDNIEDKEYENRLKARFGLAATAKSIYKLLLLDKEEQWQRITANFTAMPDILRTYLMIVSGAADIPATRFLGQSPAGLTATGESDTRNYYDRIANEQKTLIQPALTRLDEVLIRSALGSRPADIYYNWHPLWQMDDAQMAKMQLDRAQIFKIDCDSGVMDPQVMREARTNQIIEDGTYPGFEQTVADFEGAMEDLSPEAQAEKAALIASKAGNQLPAPNDKPGAPPPPANTNDPPKKAVNDMARRIRLADARHVALTQHLKDATPRTLYVYRKVQNWSEIADWYKAQGLKVTMGAEMHVTIAFSRLPLDWTKVPADWCSAQNPDGTISLAPGGMRATEVFNEATVLLFTSSELCWRWMCIKEAGATWDYPDYQPHITITLQASKEEAAKLKPWQGAIKLGPETWEEIKPGAQEAIIEDAKWAKLRPIQVLTNDELEANGIAMIADAIRNAAPPVINVTVPVTVPKTKGKTVTRVTKRDAKGRIEETESEE